MRSIESMVATRTSRKLAIWMREVRGQESKKILLKKDISIGLIIYVYFTACENFNTATVRVNL
jgi:hypothetical protein